MLNVPYRAANVIFGKIGRIASEAVTLQLLYSKRVPVLLYGLEDWPLNISDFRSLDFVIDKFFMKLYKTNMKKVLGETQTLRAGRSKVEPKNFAPPQTPFPGAQDGQNLISWRWSRPSPTNPVWWGSMHAILSYLVTDPHTQTTPARPPVANTQTGPITIHCAAKLCAQCKYKYSKILRNRIWISIIKYHYSESYWFVLK